MSAWFRFADLDRRQIILFKEAECRGWFRGVTGDGRLQGSVSVNAAQSCTGAQSFRDWAYDDGAWHHATFVIDRAADVETLYVDGDAATAQIALPTTADAQGLQLLAGTNWNRTEHAEGTLDELRIASFAEPAAWVKAQHASMSGALVEISAPEGRDGQTPAP